jgi:[ribosomal protein S5]-alanine N-acetyltransferase
MLTSQPTLVTSRLSLRPFYMADAVDVRRLAGDEKVARTTLAIPFPYPEGAAEDWIAKHPSQYEVRSEITFAITLLENGFLIGAITLMAVSTKHSRAELGYWIGTEYCSKGYCTEAVVQVICFAQEQIGISRITGQCLARNPASARVMTKAGMLPEGKLCMHVRKGGVFDDVLLFGINLPVRSIHHP